MKLRKEYIILVLVIAALALYLALRREDRAHYTLPALPALAADDITRVQVTRDAHVLELTREGDRWVVGSSGYAADPKQVQEMLASIAGIVLTALVSESGNYALYELDDTHRISVKAWQGDQLRRHFDVGKVAPSFRHTFVKIHGSDRVYHAQDAFRHRFNTSADELRDKTVLAFNRKDIREVELLQGESRILLKAASDPPEGAAGKSSAEPQIRWQAPDGRAADVNAVDALLNQLSHLTCEKFLPDKNPAEFKNPAFAVVLKGPVEHRLSIFAPFGPEDRDQPALSSVAPQPFILSEFQVKQIVKPPEAFLVEGPQSLPEKETN
jgi:hypothetical protein